MIVNRLGFQPAFLFLFSQANWAFLKSILTIMVEIRPKNYKLTKKGKEKYKKSY